MPNYNHQKIFEHLYIFDFTCFNILQTHYISLFLDKFLDKQERDEYKK